MPKKSQRGGSTEESVSTKRPKRTTKRTTKPVLIEDEATATAVNLWAKVETKVLERTIGARINGSIRSANPRSPEDKAWWDLHGIGFVSDWIRFRQLSAWKIWVAPDGEPAIEIELSIPIGDTFIKMAIDRVMVDPQGRLCIVDLKTGRRVPASSLQLGFYRYGLKKKYGIEIDLGYYWMSRSAAMTDPVDLTFYTDEKIEYLVTAFDAARKAHSFIPNTNSCNMCGYTAQCIWYKGDNK